MDARQKHPVEIKQGFYPGRFFLEEELPLGVRKSQIVMGVVAGNALPGERFKLRMLRCGENHQWGQDLLQHVTVFPQQQAEEFSDIVADDVHFQSLDDP